MNVVDSKKYTITVNTYFTIIFSNYILFVYAKKFVKIVLVNYFLLTFDDWIMGKVIIIMKNNVATHIINYGNWFHKIILIPWKNFCSYNFK